ncbi:hypothetical protein SELMODRAFT_425234 [Selaginella moellendorffii]|uniref:Uncharacterized protein n=1 Tax=Selaginella moellendorffii TaxID=88036 RepID=D8SSG0_SELML|nr:hypothetical protein SELMODRAFT_425234 [Selaginella moellendorffii]
MEPFELYLPLTADMEVLAQVPIWKSVEYDKGFSRYRPQAHLFMWTWIDYLNGKMQERGLQRVKYALKLDQAFELGQCFASAGVRPRRITSPIRGLRLEETYA